MKAKLGRTSFGKLTLIIASFITLLMFTSCPPGTYVTVTFDSNGGTPASPSSILVRAGGPYDFLATSTRIGYTLVGWFTAADQTGVQVTKDTILEHDENHTLYAHWTPTEYGITYHLDGTVVVIQLRIPSPISPSPCWTRPRPDLIFWGGQGRMDQLIMLMTYQPIPQGIWISTPTGKPLGILSPSIPMEERLHSHRNK